MIEMTLSSRHRIRNSSPGGLRPSTLPLGHGGSPHYWLAHVGKNHFLFLSNRRDREPSPELWRERQASSGVKGSGANHYPDCWSRQILHCNSHPTQNVMPGFWNYPPPPPPPPYTHGSEQLFAPWMFRTTYIISLLCLKHQFDSIKYS